MKKLYTLLICTLFYQIVSFSQIIDLKDLKSFPTAEGYGRYAGTNQPERDVYYVTNLNDSGYGSLRDALSEGNRLVLFKVSGTITLKSQISTDKSNIYIAGQTAFYDGGEGITIKSDGIQRSGLLFFTGDHIVIRYLRLRRGPGSNSGEVSGDNINFFDSSNWMLDHCSLSWSTDENISVGGGANGTMQYSISSEGLYFSTHDYSVNATNSIYQNGHSKGGIFGWAGKFTDKISFYRNLYAHNDSRNPRINSPGSRFEIVNNLMYNNRYYNIELLAAQGDESIETNVVKNLLVPGSDTRTNRFMVHTVENEYNRIYMKGNIGSHRTDDTMPEWLEVGRISTPLGETGRSLTPFDTPLSTRFNALPIASYLQPIILRDVGSNLSIDAVDNRIINDVINRTPTSKKTVQGTDPAHWNGQSTYYGIINDPSEVGGWPVITSMNSIVKDTNNDGIDDNWASIHGIINWDDVLDSYTFDSLKISNTAGYSARQIFLAYLGGDFNRIINNNPVATVNNKLKSFNKPRIFPNPVKDEINIISNGIDIEQIDVFNLHGKKIKMYLNNSGIINLEELNSGIYFITLKSLNDNYYEKIVKE